MTYVPAGSRLTWVGDFGTFAFDTANFNDTVAAVAATLKNNYDLVIESQSDTLGWSGFAAGSITLHLLTNMDRGGSSNGIEDIRGNVHDAFVKENISPNGDRITDYILAGGSSQSTGAPSAPPQDSSSSTPLSGVTSWFDNLGTKVEAGSVGFIVGGLAVVGLLVYMAVKP